MRPEAVSAGQFVHLPPTRSCSNTLDLPATMKSYIINLDRNPERLTAIGERFAAQGIAFERIRAVDAAALSPDEVQAFRRSRPSMPWVHAGQIGCFLSHFAAWRLIAEGRAPYAAVFEDDMHVSDDLALFLCGARPPLSADILRLETSTNRLRLGPPPGRGGTCTTWHGRAVRTVRSTSWCAGGYILSRTAAARLVALPEASHQPVDWMLFCFEHSVVARGLDIAQVVPALCVQDKFFHADPRQVRFASEIERGLRAETVAERLWFYARNVAPAFWKTIAGYERVLFERRAGGSPSPVAGVRPRGIRAKLGNAAAEP